MNYISVAVASKARHWPWWQSLRASGIPISSGWPWWKWNADDATQQTIPADAWRERWEKNIADAASADVLIFLDLPGENQCGSLIELGAALAHGRQCIIVSKNFWSVQHHRLCRKVETLEAAIEIVRAMRHGTQLRHMREMGEEAA
jgi:hypothetical protein